MFQLLQLLCNAFAEYYSNLHSFGGVRAPPERSTTFYSEVRSCTDALFLNMLKLFLSIWALTVKELYTLLAARFFFRTLGVLWSISWLIPPSLECLDVRTCLNDFPCDFYEPYVTIRWPISQMYCSTVCQGAT